MTPKAEKTLRRIWDAIPPEMRAQPASEAELQRFESAYGPIPTDYRWFLQNFGGGAVGAEWVDSIENLFTTHEKFQSEFGPPRGWTMTGVFVIGWDGAGNPFGIETESGRILVEDHNFGGIHEMASSLEALLLAGESP